MSQPKEPSRKGHRWRRLIAAALFLLLAALAAVVLMPSLLPDDLVRPLAEAALSDQLGRPVRLASASLRWRQGLQCTGLEVLAPERGEGAALARAERLVLRLSPLEVLRAALGAEPRVTGLRVEGLEVWLVRDRDGAWSPPLWEEGAELTLEALGSERLRALESIQIAGARVHVENRALGRELTFTGLNASLGRLSSTGQGYMSLTAELPGSSRGRITATASLSTLDPAQRDRRYGSLKAEWQDVAWPDLAAAVRPQPLPLDVRGRTSGRMSATFGPIAWQAEGAVAAEEVSVPGAAAESAVPIPRAVLGFQVCQVAPDKPIILKRISFSAPGISLENPLGEKDYEAYVDLSRPAAPRFDVRLEGTVTWGPLVQSIEPLRKAAAALSRFGGDMGIEARVRSTAKGYRLEGMADLTDTQAILAETVRKEPAQQCRLEFAAIAPRDLSQAAVERLDLVTAAGRLSASAEFPLQRSAAAPSAEEGAGPPSGKVPAEKKGSDPFSAFLADASGSLKVDLTEVRRLVDLVPAVGRALGRTEVAGPLKAQVTFVPRRPGEGPAAWDARLRADLTGLRVSVPDGPHKPALARADVSAQAVVTADARMIDAQQVTLALGDGAVAWKGTARLERPAAEEGVTTGRFEGVLRVDGVGHLGAILSPTRFPWDGTPPLAGGLSMGVDATLRLPPGESPGAKYTDSSPGAKFQGTLRANLAETAIQVPPYFQKPAGASASAAIDAKWLFGTPNFLDLTASVALPGATAKVVSQAHFFVTARPGEPDASAKSVVVQSGPVTRVKLDAQVQALEQVIELSPAALKHLKGRVHGPARVTFQYYSIPDKASLSAALDLPSADLDLGEALKKSADVPFHFAAAADVVPARSPGGEAILLCDTTLEATLGESATKVAGRVALAPPRSLDAVAALDQAFSLFRQVDLAVDATWHHGPELAAAFPWMGPLYRHLRLEGPTALKARVSGTPLEGSVQLEADGAGCRLAQPARQRPAAAAAGAGAGETTVKAAGVPASLHVAARYGQVPGEMILDRMDLKMADAEASAEGRLLFDDPRRVGLGRPSAWTMHVKGRVPDLRLLSAALPSDLRGLEPRGGVGFDIQASADPLGLGVQRCDLQFHDAQVAWLGKRFAASGPISFDGLRLATDGLRLAAGQSDVTFVGYLMDPGQAPTGSVFVRGCALAADEVEEFIEKASRIVIAEAEAVGLAPPAAAAGSGVSARLARRVQGVLARASVSGDIELGLLTLAVPAWNARYDLTDFAAKVRLRGKRLVVEPFTCGLNDGTVGGQMAIDFRSGEPVLSVAYEARDLKVRENLRPLIDTTFPGMQVFGTLTQREAYEQRLVAAGDAAKPAARAWPVGRGETVLTDGLLEGPAAPDYMTALLPGLALTTYRFKTMSNVFEKQPDGTVENRMIFDGQGYDIYIFGYTKADGAFKYTLGVDLSVSLGSKVWSRTLDQGKLPLLHYTGSIVGTKYRERYVSYVLPHELAYDVLVKRNLLLQLIRSLGEKPPDLRRLPVAPEKPKAPR